MKKLLPCIAVVMFLYSPVHSGYFLSWPQKFNLLLTGTVCDSTGVRYDVRIIPGYLNANSFGKYQWSKGLRLQKKSALRFAKGLLDIPVSTKYLGEYFTPSPWRGIGEGFMGSIHAEKVLFTEFMWEDVGSTWAAYYGKAHHAMKNQSFGWWLAYPWATLKGVVNTALRYTLGSVAVASVATYGLTLRPAFEISHPFLKIGGKSLFGTTKSTYSILEGSWGLGVNQILLGTTVPVSSHLWNTAIGIPMSLFGRAPTLSSADDWWVVIIERPPTESTPALPNEAEVKQIMDWQLEKFSFQKQYDQLSASTDAQIEALMEQVYRIKNDFNKTIETLEKQVDDKEKELPYPPEPAVWDENSLKELFSRFTTYLMDHASDSLSHEEIERILLKAHQYWVKPLDLDDETSTQSTPFDPNRLIQDEVKAIFSQ